MSMKDVISKLRKKLWLTDKEKKEIEEEKRKNRRRSLMGRRDPSLPIDMMVKVPWRTDEKWIFIKEDELCPACEEKNLKLFRYDEYYQKFCSDGCKYLYDAGWATKSIEEELLGATQTPEEEI